MGLFGFLKKTPEAKPKTAEELYQEADKLDYRKSEEKYVLLEQAAEMGHCEAQYDCANHYFYEHDYAKALYWFEKAAAQGKVFAMRRCSEIYKGEKGVEKNLEKSFYWVEKWAESGEPEGMYELGYLYRDGYGTVAADLAKSVYWLEKAAENGYKYAASMLGHLYSSGRWTKADAAKALYWFEKAVALGHDSSCFICAQMYYNGEGTEVNKKKALQLYKKAAEDGKKEAMFPLARMLASGEGAEKEDLAEAMFWYWMADRKGNKDAKYALAELVKEESLDTINQKLDQMLNSPVSDPSLLPLLQKSSELRLCFEVGLMCYHGDGDGVGIDMEEALRQFQKAAAHGNMDAQYNCGVMYRKREGTPPSRVHDERALFWTEMAAKQGHPSAQYNCAVMYFHGDGTEKDEETAKMWAQKAAAQGHEKAQDMLSRL